MDTLIAGRESRTKRLGELAEMRICGLCGSTAPSREGCCRLAVGRKGMPVAKRLQHALECLRGITNRDQAGRAQDGYPDKAELRDCRGQ